MRELLASHEKSRRQKRRLEQSYQESLNEANNVANQIQAYQNLLDLMNQAELPPIDAFDPPVSSNTNQSNNQQSAPSYTFNAELIRSKIDARPISQFRTKASSSSELSHQSKQSNDNPKQPKQSSSDSSIPSVTQAEHSKSAPQLTKQSKSIKTKSKQSSNEKHIDLFDPIPCNVPPHIATNKLLLKYAWYFGREAATTKRPG